MPEDINFKMDEIRAEKRSKKIPRKIPAKEVLQQSTAEDLNENLSGLITSVSQLTKNTLGMTKKFASIAASPVVTSAKALSEDFKIDKSKALGVGAAGAINPILGYIAEKIIKSNSENIKGGLSNFYSKAKGVMSNGSFMSKGKSKADMSEFQQGSFADVEGMQKEFMDSIEGISDKTAKKVANLKEKGISRRPRPGRAQTRLQWTTYSRTHKSGDTTEAIDLLRISNAEWMKALGSLNPEEMHNKPLPRAKKGAFVHKTGKAIVHEGEIIAPVDVLATALKELGKIRKVLTDGRINVKLAKPTKRSGKYEEYRLDGKDGGSSTSNAMQQLIQQGTTSQKYKSIEQMGSIRKGFALALSPFREEKEGTLLGRLTSNVERLTYFFGAQHADKNLGFFDKYSLIYSKLLRNHPLFYHISRTFTKFGSFFGIGKKKKETYGIELEGDTPFEQMVSGQKLIIRAIRGEKHKDDKPADLTMLGSMRKGTTQMVKSTIGMLFGSDFADKFMPHAAKGGFVKETGKAVVHKGEIITPFNIIKKQTQYLLEVAKNVKEGNKTSTKQVRLERENNIELLLYVSDIRDNLSSMSGRMKELFNYFIKNKKETFIKGYEKVRDYAKEKSKKTHGLVGEFLGYGKREAYLSEIIKNRNEGNATSTKQIKLKREYDKTILAKFKRNVVVKYIKESFRDWGLLFTPFKMLKDAIWVTTKFATKLFGKLSLKSAMIALTLYGKLFVGSINLATKFGKLFGKLSLKTALGALTLYGKTFIGTINIASKFTKMTNKVLSKGAFAALDLYGKVFTSTINIATKLAKSLKNINISKLVSKTYTGFADSIRYIAQLNIDLSDKIWKVIKNPKKMILGLTNFAISLFGVGDSLFKTGWQKLKNIDLVKIKNGLVNFSLALYESSKGLVISGWNKIKKLDVIKIGKGIGNFAMAIFHSSSSIIKKGWDWLYNPKKIADSIHNIGKLINGLTDFSKLGGKMTNNLIGKVLFGIKGGAMMGGTMTAGLAVLSAIFAGVATYFKTPQLFGKNASFTNYMATFSTELLTLIPWAAQKTLDLTMHLIDMVLDTKMAESKIVKTATKTDLVKEWAPLLNDYMEAGVGVFADLIALTGDAFTLDFHNAALNLSHLVLGDTILSWAMGKGKYEDVFKREVSSTNQGILGGLIFGILKPIWKVIKGISDATGITDAVTYLFGGILTFFKDIFSKKTLENIKLSIYKKESDMGMSYMLPDSAQEELFKKYHEDKNNAPLIEQARLEEIKKSERADKLKELRRSAETDIYLGRTSSHVPQGKITKQEPSINENRILPPGYKPTDVQAKQETDATKKVLESNKNLSDNAAKIAKENTNVISQNTTTAVDNSRKMVQQTVNNAPAPESPFFKELSLILSGAF